MSKFIDNHPSAIEVWLFYKRKEGKNGLYERLCNLIGENRISEEEFNKQVEKVKKLKQREIRQLVVNNQANIRICILSDVIDEKSIDQSFKDICKMFGTRDMDYQDFEFWFNRFTSGNRDLDQKTFSDLPLLIVSNIVENLFFPSQMLLREVSTGLRNIVDQVKPSIDRINYNIYCEDSQNIMDLSICNFKRVESFGKWDCLYGEEDNMKEAFDGMKVLLSNPRLRLDSFVWDNEEESTEIDAKFIDVINSLNHKIEIMFLNASLNGDSMIDLVKAVKPGTLARIYFGGKFEPIHIDQLAQLEQWKKAKAVYFWNVIPNFSTRSHHFQNFEYVSMKVESLSEDDILVFFTQSDKLKCFKIDAGSKASESEIVEMLGRWEIHLNEDSIGRYEIPGWNNYLGVTITEGGIYFGRETSD
uniref:F-box domain-containing protein n=1 Tax=Caenorhabditis tropicalis TaxID=1561998 RepID=A0A1I7UI88_9PELO